MSFILVMGNLFICRHLELRTKHQKDSYSKHIIPLNTSFTMQTLVRFILTKSPRPFTNYDDVCECCVSFASWCSLFCWKSYKGSKYFSPFTVFRKYHDMKISLYHIKNIDACQHPFTRTLAFYTLYLTGTLLVIKQNASTYK